MQHDNGRGLVRGGPDHAVFKLGSADPQEAGGCDGGHVSFSCDLEFTFVMPALVAGIHVLCCPRKTWMAGSSPAMTADHCRSLKRWIFPVAVFGRLSTISIQRGYFHGPIFCLTCSLSASCKPSVLASARSTTKAFGFSNPSGSASGTTAASSTAGWVISALSTSNGDTQMPETLNMSSLRPQKV